MKIKPNSRLSSRSYWTAGLALIAGLLGLTSAVAQPTIISSVPANGASGVSPSAAVVFTFSKAMDTTQTMATFFDTNGATLTTTAAWTSGNTVLTCTPTPAFPSPDEIFWEVSGQDTVGNQLGGVPAGYFIIGSGGGGGGGTPCTTVSHTNTTFFLNESWLYNQTSGATPTSDPDAPYSMIAEVVLVSNLTATSASVMLPGGSVSNLPDLLSDGQTFLAIDEETTGTDINANWPGGTYTFDVSGTSPAFPSVNVAFNVTQPNVPQLANFSTVQAVNAAQPFTLSWNAFSSRAGTNQIIINIGYNSCNGTGFATNLPGTATSTIIPANTLVPGSNYLNSEIGFINASGTTSTSPKYSAGAIRSSVTSFTLTTIGGGGGSGPVDLGNPVLSNGTLTFTVTAPAGSNITVQTSSTLRPGSWSTFLTTNSGSGTVTITDTPSKSIHARFYRAHL